LTSPYLRETYQPIPPARLRYHDPAPAPWPVTVAIMARDEQRCIRRCVDSVLASPVDAVLVLDTGSTDQTLAILASYADSHIEVVQHR